MLTLKSAWDRIGIYPTVSYLAMSNFLKFVTATVDLEPAQKLLLLSVETPCIAPQNDREICKYFQLKLQVSVLRKTLIMDYGGYSN